MNMFSDGAERNKALMRLGGIGATAATAGLLAGRAHPVRRLAVLFYLNARSAAPPCCWPGECAGSS